MLEIKGLSVSYGKHRALDDAALRVAPGEIVVILGANGAGKSTLLKALSGICEGRVTGQVTLDGQSLDGLAADRIVEAGIALVPEGRGIFGDLTVEENLRLGAYPARAQGEEQANLERVFALFPKLTERRRQVARTMSGGEQQMVAIGRAMMSSPQILTLDEPSLGLSPLLCKELFSNLRAVKDLGIGVLMVEQNARQSLAIADRGYLLENTRIVHEDSARALMTDPAVQAAYLGGGGAAPAARRQPVATAPTAVARPDPATPGRAPASPTPPAPTPPAPTPPSPTPPSRQRQSADALLGVNMADLVARADATAKAPLRPLAAPAARPAASLPAPETRGDIQAMLREFEIAAARAGKTRPLAPYAPMAPAPAADPPSADTPVTIEVYRAPRVEVYRRRPGGGFETD